MKKSVLFLCTQNSARSIMAEYLLRDLAGDRFDVYSAGFTPVASIHPLTLQILNADFGINVDGARSKSYHEFANRKFDFIFTLCREIREICVTFEGQPTICRWELYDPAEGQNNIEKDIIFLAVAKEIYERLKKFSHLSDEELEPYRMAYN